MVEQVEDAEANASLELLVGKRDSDWPGHLEIEGSEAGEPLGVSRPNEIAQVVSHGIRKSSVNVQNREHPQLERKFPLAPGQKSIWSIKGRRARPAG